MHVYGVYRYGCYMLKHTKCITISSSCGRSHNLSLKRTFHLKAFSHTFFFKKNFKTMSSPDCLSKKKAAVHVCVNWKSLEKNVTLKCETSHHYTKILKPPVVCAKSRNAD